MPTPLRSDDARILATLRGVNRELLDCEDSDVAPSAIAQCEAARGHVLEAMQILAPRLPGSPIPDEERTPDQRRAALASHQGALDSEHPLQGLDEAVEDLTRRHRGPGAN